MKKKLFILLALLVAMTLVFVACKDDPTPPDDTTVADQPTEEPTQGEEDPTQAPDTDPETPEPGTDEPDEPTTPAPDTDEPDTPAPDTDEPETPEPETADPMEPVNVFDAEDIQTVTGSDPGHLTQDCVTLEDGFVHIVPIGPDPYYYPFAGVDGARYVAIRYRTDATGADIQMYIGSTGGGPSDDSTMLRQPVVADSEWHVAIFDTQSLIDAGKYDGKYVSYFRFDALEAGYKLNENGETYKNEDGSWARYSLPEGCSIDVAYIGFFHSEEAAKKYDFDLNKAPMWDADKSVILHQNFDQFFLGNGSPDDATINNLNLYHAVNIPNWDKVATLPDFSVETLAFDPTLGDWRTHGGLDIAAEQGVKVLAMAPGTVTQVYDDGLMGTTVILDHGDGLTTLYCNLAGQPAVKAGDAVETGTILGTVGTTAIAESGVDSHLHLEAWKNGEPVDPMEYLPAK